MQSTFFHVLAFLLRGPPFLTRHRAERSRKTVASFADLFAIGLCVCSLRTRCIGSGAFGSCLWVLVAALLNEFEYILNWISSQVLSPPYILVFEAPLLLETFNGTGLSGDPTWICFEPHVFPFLHLQGFP